MDVELQDGLFWLISHGRAVVIRFGVLVLWGYVFFGFRGSKFNTIGELRVQHGQVLGEKPVDEPP